jgi:protein CpxP
MGKLLYGIALGAVLILTANMASAQAGDTAASPPSPEGGMGRGGPMNPAAETAHLTKLLDLTSEQQTQVLTLLTAQQAERRTLEENQTITHQQFLTQTKTLHERTQAKIQTLLTDTQKEKFQQMLAHMHHGPPPADGEAPPAPPAE